MRIISFLVTCIAIFLATAANCTESKNIYGGQFDFGGYYITESPHLAGFMRAYVPLWQNNYKVFFADARGIVGNRGPGKEGNLGLGFRELYDHSKKMFGTYAFYTAQKTSNNANFSQINLGTEYWLDHYFFGTNFYMPVGKRSEVISSNNNSFLAYDQFGNIILVEQQFTQSDVTLIGGDVILAYQPNNNLTAYTGYFYYHSATRQYALPVVQGPMLRLRYSHFPKSGQLLSFLNEATLEGQAQYDGVRGILFYGGVRLTLAFGGRALSRMQQHMVDPILRGMDLVALSKDANTTTQTIVIPN